MFPSLQKKSDILAKQKYNSVNITDRYAMPYYRQKLLSQNFKASRSIDDQTKQHQYGISRNYKNIRQFDRPEYISSNRRQIVPTRCLPLERKQTIEFQNDRRNTRNSGSTWRYKLNSQAISREETPRYNNKRYDLHRSAQPNPKNQEAYLSGNRNKLTAQENRINALEHEVTELRQWIGLKKMASNQEKNDRKFQAQRRRSKREDSEQSIAEDIKKLRKYNDFANNYDPSLYSNLSNRNFQSSSIEQNNNLSTKPYPQRRYLSDKRSRTRTLDQIQLKQIMLEKEMVMSKNKDKYKRLQNLPPSKYRLQDILSRRAEEDKEYKRNNSLHNDEIKSINSHKTRQYPPRRYDTNNLYRSGQHSDLQPYKNNSLHNDEIKQINSHKKRYYPLRRYDTNNSYRPSSHSDLQSQMDSSRSWNGLNKSKNKKGIRLLEQYNRRPYRQKIDPKKESIQRQISLLCQNTLYYQQIKKMQQASDGSSRNVQKVGKNKKTGQIQEDIQKFSINFPGIKNVDKFIQDYKPLTNFHKHPDASKGVKIKQYCDSPPGKQYFYFGRVDSTTKNRCGYGVLITKNNIYQGIWDDNKIVMGAEKHQKYLYKGDFKDMKKQGEGYCEYANGQQYQGQWKNNKRFGNGKWISASGQEYQGRWADGKASGHGIYRSQQYGVYEGEFYNYKKNGEGTEILPNGDRYVGTFVDGQPHGEGIYQWANGLIYEGNFIKGVRQGKGFLYMKNIFQFESKFKDDLPQGRCKIKYENNQFFYARLENGKVYDIKQATDQQHLEIFGN